MKAFLRFVFIFTFIKGVGLILATDKKGFSPQDGYIKQFSDIAQKHEAKYKIPASIILAQGILESSAGSSELARVANNHFGIKCSSDWKGERFVWADDKPDDNFRKYKSAEESYKDHAEFLLRNPRYGILFTYDIRDYKAWARGLQACGYATDKGYANKLISIIEEYNLHKYYKGTIMESILPEAFFGDNSEEISEDDEDFGGKDKKKKKPALGNRNIHKTYSLIYILAEEGDNLNKIAKDTGYKLKDLLAYNELPENHRIKKGDIIYLEQKQTKADKPYFEHLVKRGESLHSISQRYGIRMDNLCKMNGITKKTVVEGDVLRLR